MAMTWRWRTALQGTTLGEGGRGRRVHLSAGLGLDCRGYRASHRWAAPFYGYRGCGRRALGTYRVNLLPGNGGYSGLQVNGQRQLAQGKQGNAYQPRDGHTTSMTLDS